MSEPKSISAIRVVYDGESAPSSTIIVYFREGGPQKVRGSVQIKVDFAEDVSRRLFGDATAQLQFKKALFEMAFPIGCVAGPGGGV